MLLEYGMEHYISKKKFLSQSLGQEFSNRTTKLNFGRDLSFSWTKYNRKYKLKHLKSD